MEGHGVLVPERLPGPDGLLLRRWLPEDAPALSDAIAESLEHLRPWMAWIADEPLAIEQRRSRLIEFERDRLAGGDAVLGIFLDGRVVGGCGLHRRIGHDGLEIGYWVHPRFTRRGLATTTGSLLTDAAFTLPAITHVEIHHDKANLASAAVPRRLGFWLLAEVPDEIEAPAEVGVECRWHGSRAMGSPTLVATPPSPCIVKPESAKRGPIASRRCASRGGVSRRERRLRRRLRHSGPALSSPVGACGPSARDGALRGGDGSYETFRGIAWNGTRSVLSMSG
jgi:ribosomal-protein-serine acetyltransferase